MNNYPNILLVDDKAENLIYLEEVISNIRVNPIIAFSGKEALEKTDGLELALAILDVRMPEMNGYELAVRLNEKRTTDKIPVIFLTALFFDEMELFKGYDAGAVDYIFKPVNSKILLSKCNIFLDLFNQKQTIINNKGLLERYAEKLTAVNTALKQSEQRYRSYIDNAPDGVFVSEKTGKYVEVNESACKITGYSKAELLTMSISDIISEEWINEVLADFNYLDINGFSSGDSLFKHKDGSKRWWSVETVKLAETRFLIFAKDISDRKRAEDGLKSSLEQLQKLTNYIEEVRENERVAISRELHDDLGQALTAVKIDLGSIRQGVSDTVVIAKINKVSALVSETIKTVQRITAQLRPEIIDDLGLEAAIEWFTSEFAKRNQIEVLLELDPGLTFSHKASHIIFRIIQESLTNIARHAKATQVHISLGKMNDKIELSIFDNGIGITDPAINSSKSFGLISMKERAVSIGGNFKINPGDKYGTTIILTFPVNP